MGNISSDSTTQQQSWHPIEVARQKLEGNRFFRWWYSFTTPPPVSDNANFVKREGERRARILSCIALYILVDHIFALPVSVLVGPISLAGNIFVLLFLVIALRLNRMGKTTLSAYTMIFIVEVVTIGFILSFVPFQPIEIEYYNIYFIAILVAVSLFPASSIFLFALLHSVLIIGGILFLPATPALAQELRNLMTLIPIISIPVASQWVTAGIAYLWTRSTMRAIERANRAEMVATLEHTIAEERASTERGKQELEESIQQLVQTHIAATQGQVANQIPYPPAKILWPLVGAMNLLWARLQRTHHIEREHQQLQQAIVAYASMIQKNGNASLPLTSTGTVLDQVILAAQTKSNSETHQKFP